MKTKSFGPRPIHKTLYFAYGSNLNVAQMHHRCPDAEPVGPMWLKHWRLVFRGVADIVRDENSRCPGGVWWISDADERKLDLYEGVSHGLYRKEYLPIAPFYGATAMLVYVMNSEGIYPPSESYLDGIIDGYRNFHMTAEHRRYLNEALAESWDDKRPTEHERKRAMKKGYPKLARPADDNCQNCGFCPKPKKAEPVVMPMFCEHGFAMTKPCYKCGRGFTAKPEGKVYEGKLSDEALRRINRALSANNPSNYKFNWR